MNASTALAAENPSNPTDRVDLLIERYGGRTPRYTSYPTAVQFTPQVTAREYVAWLQSLRRDAGAVSLYLHVPFCDRMCWYCGCNTVVVNRRSPIEDYVSRLLREIDLVADTLSQRLVAGSVHFGGGTPNMLAPAEVGAALAKLAERFDFGPDAEIAAEIDPRTLTAEWVRAAADGGLNRASLGVQDFDSSVQKAINREQPFDVVARAAGLLRDAGVSSLNLDLMYGLPRQTLKGLEETIDKALALSPDRLSLFGYAHVPWMKAHQKLILEDELPDSRLRYEMQRRAAEFLEARGWRRLGLDHFAKADDSLAAAAGEGRMRRNFQGYTTDEAPVLIGFGASSIGRMPQGYVQNAAAVPQWREKLERGELPVARGVEMSADDRFRAEIIERLMCDFTIDLAEVCGRHDRRIEDLADAFERLKPMESDGIATVSGPVVAATRDGRDFIRSICAAFDAHLDREATRHSRGV
ncbi:MAG: oxygen-independent coproporphyrinogen III oxidase [Hyphomicrobiales bacterium]|nr:oxygen-independent coproporphyrinogen III oxidase [Hyphomicrobiales bacterium]